MDKSEAILKVKGWELESMLLESYAYSAGSVEPLPNHSHHEYQLGLSLNCGGEYFYRGATHLIPAGSITILHSGEPHTPVGPGLFPTPAAFRLMYVDPALFQTTVSEMTERAADPPFFPAPVVLDKELVKLFLTLHAASEKGLVSKLEQDSRILFLFARFAARYAQNRPSSRPLKSARPAIASARDYIEDNFAENISLKELAQVAGLSTFYLCRLFCKEIGMPPHAYQTQVRIAHAKRLITSGVPLSKIASEAGFYDQSHLGWHFKRLVGVTPGSYSRESKNFLYIQD